MRPLTTPQTSRHDFSATSDVDPVLTAKEVAEGLRCSKSQVYRLMSGEVDGLTALPHLALGRKKVVLRSVLERWKRQNLSGIIPGDSEKTTVDAMH
jgi:predicted DNA-binding transcriptional regulator AlpA